MGEKESERARVRESVSESVREYLIDRVRECGTSPETNFSYKEGERERG